MVRALKLVPPHWVRGTRRNSKLLLYEAPKRPTYFWNEDFDAVQVDSGGFDSGKRTGIGDSQPQFLAHGTESSVEIGFVFMSFAVVVAVVAVVVIVASASRLGHAPNHGRR